MTGDICTFGRYTVYARDGVLTSQEKSSVVEGEVRSIGGFLFVLSTAWRKPGFWRPVTARWTLHDPSDKNRHQFVAYIALSLGFR